MHNRLFSRIDWICALVTALVAFGVYAWTAAPNVTLLDSGEFIVAAQHFGVPHPTGYPLWTLLTWLFLFLPLGNAAWEVAIFSGLCGAAAAGLATLLIRNTSVWLMAEASQKTSALASATAISLGLVFAFSESMWSQSTIAEVYSLHALLIGFYLLSLYAWIRRPERESTVYWIFFTLSLAFSNHHLTLALAPLPFLVALLLRRDMLCDLLVATAVAVLIGYLSFALLASDMIVFKAAIRLTYLVAVVFLIGLWINRLRMRWKLIAFLPFVIALGLLPYAYLPFASSTNPPMNWGYTRTLEGFFYSFNRSQYPGSLSDQSLRLFSKVLGIAETGATGSTRESAQAPTDPDAPDAQLSAIRRIQDWAQFFWFQIAKSFSPIGVLFFFASFVGVLRKPLAARVWVYLLILAFALAAFLQPMLDKPRLSRGGWWLQMPYHTYTNLIFGILCGIGGVMVLLWFIKKAPRLSPAVFLILALPFWPLAFNAGVASQRGRWFGWQYGHDMLKDLPRGAVVFGGTDAGRFVPTYMILGESGQPPRHKRDPNFDRSDLYIITQNALADRFYLAYIRDHYSAARPPVAGAFEKWLGRDRAYPDKPLALPTIAEMREMTRETSKKLAGQGADPSTLSAALHGTVARWIFEKNKDAHEFFVEESFPMEWTYDHAVPEGLIYRINPEPIDKLPPEVVDRDFAFWHDYIARLKADPNFARDFDAQRSFSRLRLTGANLYEHRGMSAEAERAFRQAIDLWIGNSEALTGLARLLWERGEFDEPISLFKTAETYDPNNIEMIRLRLQTEERKKLEREIAETRQAAARQPESIEILKKLISLYAQTGNTKAFASTITEANDRLGKNHGFLELMIDVSESRSDPKSSAHYAQRLADLEPENAEAHYRIGRALYVQGKKEEALAALQKAIQFGGHPYRENLRIDPVFKAATRDPEILKLMTPTPE